MISIVTEQDIFNLVQTELQSKLDYEQAQLLKAQQRFESISIELNQFADILRNILSQIPEFEEFKIVKGFHSEKYHLKLKIGSLRIQMTQLLQCSDNFLVCSSHDDSRKTVHVDSIAEYLVKLIDSWKN